MEESGRTLVTAQFGAGTGRVGNPTSSGFALPTLHFANAPDRPFGLVENPALPAIWAHVLGHGLPYLRGARGGRCRTRRLGDMAENGIRDQSAHASKSPAIGTSERWRPKAGYVGFRTGRHDRTASSSG